MEKSKSGRVRKKPKKFVDYESPGEIDNVATVDQRQQKKVKKKPTNVSVDPKSVFPASEVPSTSSTSTAKPKKTLIGDLNRALQGHGIRPQKVGDKVAKVKLLKTLAERDKDHPVKTDFDFGNLEKELEEKRIIFEQDENLWKGIGALKSKHVPKDFNLETVTKFLRESKVKGVRINGEEIDVSTVKPVVSGIIMYYSHKTIDCKFMVKDGKLLVIAVMDSSMGKDRRFPGVAIKLDTASVYSTKCSCIQRLAGRCKHIACVLYLLEEVGQGEKPKLMETPTDVGCYWNKGAISNKNPGPIGEKSYNKKLKEDRNRGYDPRPEAFQLKSNEEIQEEIHEFLIACHDKKNPDKKTGKHIHSNFYCLYATMKLDEDEIEPAELELTPAEEKIKENWLLIETKFKDYVLDAEDLEDEARSELLGVIKKLFMDNLSDMISVYENDPLNTEDSIHITGSEGQSKSKKWKKNRQEPMN